MQRKICLSIIGGDPSGVAKTNRLHVDIFRFCYLQVEECCCKNLLVDRLVEFCVALEFEPVVSQTQLIHFVTSGRVSPFVDIESTSRSLERLNHPPNNTIRTSILESSFLQMSSLRRW